MVFCGILRGFGVFWCIWCTFSGMSRLKMLYFGAGLDVSVINIFSEKDIVFIDSQPCSEFNEPYYEGFYRPDFMKQLIETYGKLGFKLVAKNWFPLLSLWRF